MPEEDRFAQVRRGRVKLLDLSSPEVPIGQPAASFAGADPLHINTDATVASDNVEAEEVGV